jgi:hypothetical protein
MLTNSALIGHGSNPQDHAELGRPLPPGATLYARGWTGIEARPEPRRWLIGVALRKEKGSGRPESFAFTHLRRNARTSGLAVRRPRSARQSLEGFEGLLGKPVVKFADLLRLGH